MGGNWLQIAVRGNTEISTAILMDIENRLSDGLMAVAFEGEGYAKRKMGSSGSPSMPGGFPGIDTGNLRAGIRAEHKERLTKRIVCSADYGLYLEFGTVRMAARPFMRPTVVHLANSGVAADIIQRFIR